MKIIKVGIVDDHDLLVDSLIRSLKIFKDIQIVLDASDGKELTQKLKLTVPDILLLDIEMSGLNGEDIIKLVAKKYPSMKIVILSAYFHKNHIVKFFDLGAKSFMPKDCKIHDLVEAIRAVSNAGIYITNEVHMILNEVNKQKHVSGPFTKIEMEIIHYIMNDMTSAEIANHLGKTKSTIDFHRSKILDKAGTKTTAGVIAYCINNKLVNKP